MPTLLVDNLRFVFVTNWAAQKYDEWTYYRQALSARPLKAVDVVAMKIQQAPGIVWLVEAKDFRVVTEPPEPSNLKGLADTVAAKVRDTLAGLNEAALYAVGEERVHAARAVGAQQNRVVLHLEPYVGVTSKLFPQKFEAGVLQKLKQAVRNVDKNPLVLKIANTPTAGLPWSVT